MSLKGSLSHIHKALYAFYAGTTCMLLLIITGLWSPQVYADGIIIKVTSNPRPSLPGKPYPYKTYYACYSAYTGEPINCEFTHKINGVKTPVSDSINNGGHFHYTNRPLSLNYQQLQHPGDSDPTPYGVAGFTSSSSTQVYGIVEHVLPEVSGILDGEATLTLPPRWYCIGGCYTYNSWRYEKTYDIGIRDLATLPANPSIYQKIRTLPDNDHPNAVAFNGTQFALQLLPIVAQDYYVLSGRILSINDMSLPKGGVFDDNENWGPPHQTHREGKDADINQGGVACYLDQDLRTVVDQLLSRITTPSGNIRSPLLCESCAGGTLCRKHIDLESLL